eukprot:s2071_g16.t1
MCDALSKSRLSGQQKLERHPSWKASKSPAVSGAMVDSKGVLTREVGRLAIRTASQGRRGKESIEDCLACVQAVYDSVSLLPFLPGSLGQKMSPLKGTLRKIEQVLYELALLSQGVSLKASEDADE